MNHYLKKFLILGDSCIAQHILNIYHFYYENLYYKYDIEIQTQRKALNILRNIEQKSNKFLLSHPFEIKGPKRREFDDRIERENIVSRTKRNGHPRRSE